MRPVALPDTHWPKPLKGHQFPLPVSLCAGFSAVSFCACRFVGGFVFAAALGFAAVSFFACRFVGGFVQMFGRVALVSLLEYGGGKSWGRKKFGAKKLGAEKRERETGAEK